MPNATQANLSSDVWTHLCLFLPCHDLNHVSQCNKSMYKICQNNFIWKNLVRNVLQMDLETTIENYQSIENWKLFFKSNMYHFTEQHGAHITVDNANNKQAKILHLSRWESVQVNRTLVRGNTYKIAFQVTRLVPHSNAYEIVIGITECDFDYLQKTAEHTVIGHSVSPQGIGLALHENIILNDGWEHKMQSYCTSTESQERAKSGDTYGMVLKHGAVESKLRFYKNGAPIFKFKGNLPNELYFGVSLYKEQTVTIVPFKKY